jgi:hypothetical protein
MLPGKLWYGPGNRSVWTNSPNCNVFEVPSVIFLDNAGKRIMAADRTFGGVFLSEDGGARWEKVAAAEFASPVRSLARDPARPQDFYLGTQSEGVYRLRLQSSP